MKHVVCVAFVLLLSIGFLQAADPPYFHALRGHRMLDDSVMHYVNSIAFSPDGKKVVTVGADRTVRVWDLEAGKAWGIYSGIELHKWEAVGTSAIFSLNGKKVALVPSRPGQWASVRIWDVESGKELQRSTVNAMESFFDEFPMPRKGIRWDSGGMVQILDAESGNVLRTIGAPTGRAFPVLSPDEKMIVTAGLECDTTVRVWDVESGRELRKLGERERPAIFAIFSPDNKKLVTAERDSTVRFWDVESWEELKKLEISFGSDGDFIAYSPDGKKIASAGQGGIQVLDIESRRVQKLKLPDSVLNIHSVAFSPDGKKVAVTGDFTFAGIWVLE